MQRLVSASVFQNPRILNGRAGVVQIGEVFDTDDVHAEELKHLGLAVAAPEPEVVVLVAETLPPPEPLDLAAAQPMPAAPGRRRA